MKTINTKQILITMKGETLKDESDKPIEIGVILSNVLAGKTSNPAYAWQLGKKFATQDSVDLLAEDVVFVKKEITDLAVNPNTWLRSITAGQILEILDAKDEPVEGIKKTEDDK